MKRASKAVGLMAIVLALTSLPASAGAAPSGGALRIRLAEGDVQLRISETGEWAPVAVNTPILEGDEIWVPDEGRAAIQTNEGAHIRLDGGTSFQVLRTDRDDFQFHVAQGYVYVLRTGRKRGALQFDTPDASVRSFGPSTFRIDVPGGETDVLVFKGSVTAESEDGFNRVRAGRMLALGPGGLRDLSPLPGPDAWQRWNEGRDRAVLARRPGDRYLPVELRVYSDDFERYGRWVVVRGYGNCWVPTVVVNADWAPYRHGRWCWRGGDYVWIGDEPWGWTPYHYGRWSFGAGIGWFWVPPEPENVYWGPGYVGWVHTPDHVAWVPLAPREIYYGHGDYGRYSVNVANVDVGRIRVANVYLNVNVVNSITVVHHVTFTEGRPAPVAREATRTVRQDFLARRGVASGRPPIRPVPTSYRPALRAVPDSRRPPERVRKIELGRLREARPLVRDEARSAIRPDAAPKPLQVREVEAARPLRERTRPRPQEPAAPGTDRGKRPPEDRDRPDAARGGPAGREGGDARPPVERTRPQQRPEAEPATPQPPPPPVERVRPQQPPPAERVRPQPPPKAEPATPQPPPPVERVRPQPSQRPAERFRPQQPQPKAEPAAPQEPPPPVERVRPQPSQRPAERVRPQPAPQPAERVRPQRAAPPEKEMPESRAEKAKRARDKEKEEDRGEGRGGR